MKIPGPIYGVSKHWNNGFYREKNWNGLKQEENWLSPNVSVVSKRFETKLKQALEKWKYQAPFLVFRNTETMDYVGKKLKLTETWQKLTKSKCFSCFETFQNKIETRSGKSENTRPHFWCFETLKQWIIKGKNWNGLKQEESWLSPNVSVVLKCFETKLKQALKKWKYQAPFLVFRNTETMDNIGKKLKRTETWQKLTKFKCFSCFETLQNKFETRSGKSENTRPHFWCFETLKQWII